MRIDGNDIFRIFRTSISCPHTTPREEETLLGGEAVGLLQGLLFHSVLEGTEGDIQTTVITDVLTKRQFTINKLTRHSLKLSEGILQHLRALLEVLLVCLSPPVVLITSLVEL